MPKIPRDLSGDKLAKLFRRYDYRVVRRWGSHIRLVSNLKKNEHKITIPAHDPVKIGTLNNVLADVAEYLEISKQDLIKELFGKKF